MKYDIIVIGAGAAGLNIAMFMNRVGFKVLMINKSDKDIGGDCLNYGCVPSKALIHVAKLANSVKESEELGLSVKGQISAEKVVEYIKSKQDHIREHEDAAYFRKQGIDVVLGMAKFAGKRKVIVNDQIYEGKKIVLATGSRPRMLKIPGVEKVTYYNNENIFSMKKIPKNLVVIGGGPVSIELAQALQRLGSQVTIVYRGSMFLGREDPEIADILRKKLEKEGIVLHFNCIPMSFPDSKSVIVQRSDGKKIKLSMDAVLVAIGREFNLDLDLDIAGIKLDDTGKKIKVDPYLRTTNKHVFASGDIAGGPMFTHATEVHAGIILRNFFAPFKKKVNYDKFAWVTFTDPEIATFGLNEAELIKRKIEYEKLIQDYGDVDRGITDNASGKAILFVSKEKLLGGSVIAPNAGEIVQELILANTAGLDIKHLFGKVYPYPVASRINKQALSQHFGKKLTPRSKSLLQFLYKLFS